MRKSAHSLIVCGVRFEALGIVVCAHNTLSANIACEFSHNQLRSFFYFLLLLSAMNYSGVSQQSPGAVYQQTQLINFLKVELPHRALSLQHFMLQIKKKNNLAENVLCVFLRSPFAHGTTANFITFVCNLIIGAMKFY
jgi:hypothetical protein